MSEVSQEVLAQRLTDAEKTITIGSQYRHYKNRLYTVITIALDEETLEPNVIYQAEYGKKLIWIRPISDWLAGTEWHGEMVPRFTKVAD